MKIKKETVNISLVVILLISAVGCLYYYFFVKLDTDWMFWKTNGEDIEWSSIEYDDDFFPSDTIEIYGEFGEWKLREFKPIYAGYGTTEDGLNYLIGKYLDDEGNEQTVKILVSGDGIVDWPYPDDSFLEFYNSYYKEKIAVRGETADPEVEADIREEDKEYSKEDEFLPFLSSENYACPDELILTSNQVREFVGTADDFPGYSFVELNNYYEFCNPYKMFYSDFPAKILSSFEDVVEKLEIGSQFTVRYLESQKSFEDCKYDSEYVDKIFCANQNLNEIYSDFVVGIYIEIE